ncbi:nucleotidyltransferase family protein [Tenacibaculum halocynthiae]|uniref:nucleotidyltransferase family protein n=1 Tax=Tenacibaculum halocynthiae TaxID=1254437 RepID=UPI003D65A46C
MNKTAIIILAAGSSSRMGSSKQLLPFKHTTLLGWTIEQALNLKTATVYCVLGANFQLIKKEIEHYPIQILHNYNYENGLSSSIVTGIKYIIDKRYDSVTILLADQPKITSFYIHEMLLISKENPTKIIASNYCKKVGVPAIFPATYFSELVQLTGDKGAKELLNKKKENLMKMTPFNLIDIDTPEDYNKLTN